jgi:hypothetical protein
LTDFNFQDPGITILEVLCYAITDLGYRANFPIQDILASSNNYPAQKQFFSALEILTCNPVTENDFRKILIDLNGIKNAWLVKTEKQEMWIKKNGRKLEARQPDNTNSEILLNGLYDVYIDLDDTVNHYDMETVDDITKSAWQQLWKHRNLCEDYVGIHVVEEMEFGIDAQVELCPDADVNKVAGDIYYSIQEFLTPTIQFYNFNEMYEGKKRSCDEIFEGPVLCNGFIDDDELNKAQLRKEIYVSDLWQVIMDVCGVAAIKKLTIQTCSDTPEKTSDKKWCLQVDKYHKPKLNFKCSKVLFQKGYDCVYTDERKVLEQVALQQKLHQPRRKSQHRLFSETGIDRNLEEYFTIQDEFPATYKMAEGQITKEDPELRKAQVKQLKGYLLLFDEMLANYLALLSRVKDLLSVSQPEEHTYFYQTLYNISGVRDLIKAFPAKGTDADWEKFKNNKENDYVKDLQTLIETEIRRKERKNIFLDHLLARFGESFTDYVVKSYQEQCICTASQEGITIEDKLLKDKTAFLLHIPELSSERGKGFNYKAVDCGKPDVWDTNNVEGLKKRVCMYLGYKDYQRKTLTCPPEFDIVLYRDVTEGVVKSYRLQLKNKENKVLLNGSKSYRQQQNALKAAKDLKEQVLKGNISLSDAESPEYASVVVKDKEDNIALESEVMKKTKAEALKETIEKLAFPEDCAVEGFHIVEHILLRPEDDGYTLFDPVTIPLRIKITEDEIIDLNKYPNNRNVNGIVKSEAKGSIPFATINVKGTSITTKAGTDGKFSITVPAGRNTLIISSMGFDDAEIDINMSSSFDIVLREATLISEDPYSFWITVAMPEWLPQFKDNANAQNSFEQLVRRETPAHIVVKFCWLAPKDMYRFETVYLRWLYENALEKPDERELRENVSNLVAIMKECEYSIRDLGTPCLNG